MGVDAALIAMDRACESGSIVRDLHVRQAHASDESEVEPVVPEAVVYARTTPEVAAIMTAASEHGVPVTPRSGGTGKVGGAVPVPGGIVLAFAGMDQLLDIERDDLRVHVQPGVVLGRMQELLGEHGLFYGPDPSSWESCCIGGNIGCNAGGPRAFKYGVTRDWVLGLEVVTADGAVMNVGRPTAKGVTGYDLAGLVTGSEGTLAVVTRATLKLRVAPESTATLLVFVPDETALTKIVTAALVQRFVPRCMEYFDALALEILAPDLPVAVPAGAGGALLIELDGDAREIERSRDECGNVLLEAGANDVVVASGEPQREALWRARRGMSAAMRARTGLKFSEDVVVPRSRMGELLDRCRRLADIHGIEMPTYGHAGDGNLHVQFLYRSVDDLSRVQAAIKGLFEATIQLGGTLSGEHGIGVLKAPHLGIEQSPGLIALQQRIKDAFDPKGILNPGKIFPGSARRFHGAC